MMSEDPHRFKHFLHLVIPDQRHREAHQLLRDLASSAGIVFTKDFVFAESQSLSSFGTSESIKRASFARAFPSSGKRMSIDEYGSYRSGSLYSEQAVPFNQASSDTVRLYDDDYPIDPSIAGVEMDHPPASPSVMESSLSSSSLSTKDVGGDDEYSIMDLDTPRNVGLQLEDAGKPPSAVGDDGDIYDDETEVEAMGGEGKGLSDVATEQIDHDAEEVAVKESSGGAQQIAGWAVDSLADYAPKSVGPDLLEKPLCYLTNRESLPLRITVHREVGDSFWNESQTRTAQPAPIPIDLEFSPGEVFEHGWDSNGVVLSCAVPSSTLGAYLFKAISTAVGDNFPSTPRPGCDGFSATVATLEGVSHDVIQFCSSSDENEEEAEWKYSWRGQDMAKIGYELVGFGGRALSLGVRVSGHTNPSVVKGIDTYGVVGKGICHPVFRMADDVEGEAVEEPPRDERLVAHREVTPSPSFFKIPLIEIERAVYLFHVCLAFVYQNPRFWRIFQYHHRNQHVNSGGGLFQEVYPLSQLQKGNFLFFLSGILVRLRIWPEMKVLVQDEKGKWVIRRAANPFFGGEFQVLSKELVASVIEKCKTIVMVEIWDVIKPTYRVIRKHKKKVKRDENGEVRVIESSRSRNALLGDSAKGSASKMGKHFDNYSTVLGPEETEDWIDSGIDFPKVTTMGPDALSREWRRASAKKLGGANLIIVTETHPFEGGGVVRWGDYKAIDACSVALGNAAWGDLLHVVDPIDPPKTIDVEEVEKSITNPGPVEGESVADGEVLMRAEDTKVE